jgi:serine/threonine protein kinase
MRARRIFNNFELVEVIGEGGMGSVFKAYDHNLGRMVALKVLRREMSAREDERAKLEQEARVTASVNHPHVVRVYSFGEADGQFYLAMELVEKGSLDDLMSVQSRVSEAQVLEIGVQMAQGLEAAAEKGLVHRDVKPGNILFADAHTTKIVDFGLARVLAEEAGARGEIWGTPYYIAPERLNYEPEDFRSDIYSLGGTLFHAIAGRPPFEAESASLVALKQIKSHPASLEAFAPDVAPETAYVINRMLEKNPDDRYPSYAELIEHLMHIPTNDGFVPRETQAAMHEGLDDHPRVTLHDYDGLDHGFATETGKRRDEAAATLADSRTAAFFAEALG